LTYLLWIHFISHHQTWLFVTLVCNNTNKWFLAIMWISLMWNRKRIGYSLIANFKYFSALQFNYLILVSNRKIIKIIIFKRVYLIPNSILDFNFNNKLSRYIRVIIISFFFYWYKLNHIHLMC
jgi:hypothetical protein